MFPASAQPVASDYTVWDRRRESLIGAVMSVFVQEPHRPMRAGTPDNASLALLTGSAVLWFGVAAAGQALFALYIGLHYGGSALAGDASRFNQTLTHGIVSGDPIGSGVVALHIVFAFVMTVCGPLQLLPQLRRRAPKFHRWNGRVYITTAVLISIGGLYMVWTRGVLGPMVNGVAISINALLILVCADMALRHALRREFDAHRRWATRLFLVASGVWFFRVGLMLWILINRGPVGVGSELDGPVAVTLAFGQYLLPLALYELYLRARATPVHLVRAGAAALLLVVTAGMAAGVATAFVGLWLPHI